ncbi:MAG: prepilin-type N-terminal cleavage/methylation domain-containing protein [Planctomycetes bacterium]|nr:prepilin-type N-terminal cleavage/methylation domain-containing protein [Planctomycetota bacterium]
MCHRNNHRTVVSARPGTTTRRRDALTLIELLISISIMAVIAVSLGSLARAVQVSFAYSQGHGDATQHARVAMAHIARTVREATANEQFPGVLVLSETEGSWQFPDTLVVWHPDGPAADPAGLPRYNELVVFSPDPTSPSILAAWTMPGDTGIVPSVDDTSAWATVVAAIKSSPQADRVELTDLLRTASVDNASSPRGVVRFTSELSPSASDWTAYRGGSRTWESLPWVQGIHGLQTGLRQVWVRIELQLLPPDPSSGVAPEDQPGVPFFGSAALYYSLAP